MKTVLGLELPTDPRWVNMTEMSLEDILTDHAYCEQKAATSAISMIQKYPEYEEMVKELSALVAEEWGHFRAVLAEMEKRGLKLGKQRKDEYVNALLDFQKKGGRPESTLLERLLTFALIEARSCERFRLLSLNLPDEHLQKFYHKFMVSEAGHYKMFLKLAIKYCGEEVTRARWKEYLEFEADLMTKLETRGDRMH